MSDDIFGNHEYTEAEKRIIRETNEIWETLEPVFLRVQALHGSTDPFDIIAVREMSDDVAEALRELAPVQLMNLVTFLAGNYIAVTQHLLRITGAEEE